MLTTSQQQIEEQEAVEKLLTEAGLSREALLALAPTRQARFVRYFLPDTDGQVEGEERAALLGLGKWLWREQQAAEKPVRTLRQALLDLFLGTGETNLAGELFEAVYPEPETGHVTYFQRIVRLCFARGDSVGAWEAALDLRRTHPATLTTFSVLADLLLRMNDRTGAKRCYNQALELNPDHTASLLGLAEILLTEGEFEQVIEIANRIEAGARVNWRTLHKLASLWVRLGKAGKAQELENAARLWRERGLLAALDGQEAEIQSETSTAGEILEGIQVKPAAGQALAEAEIPVLAQHLLQEVFGHDTFRAGQAEVIASVLAGRDTLAVLPTGGGKSLCYQLPALVLESPVLVLSPLISLMKDQFDNLPPGLREESALINSSLEPGEAARVLRQVADGSKKLRLIYAAPERLRQYPFVAAMAQAGLGMLVVDEAHCVSMWGNDFRPDYLFIRRALDDLAKQGNRPTLLAVTATATPAIADEIATQLGRPLVTVRGTMLRSNLRYRVIQAKSREREARLVELCRELEGSGIIYVRSREKAEHLAAILQQAGVSASHYHAGLSTPGRKRTQDDWGAGRTRVVVATVAFGMGIDKPDVRFIIHYNLPDSVENYVQESGRAGRDGLPSECILFYAPSDKSSLTHFRKEEAVDLPMLRNIFGAIKKALGRRPVGLLSQEKVLLMLNPGGYDYSEAQVSETQLRVGLSLLERAGLLVRHYDFPLSADISLQEANPTELLAQLAVAYNLVPTHWQELDLLQVAGVIDYPLPTLEPLLLDWARAGQIQYRPGPRQMLVELTSVSKENASEQVNRLINERDEAQLRRVEQIGSYARSPQCRHAYLARHFGERLPASRCGACDICGFGPSPEIGQSGGTAPTNLSVRVGPRTYPKEQPLPLTPAVNSNDYLIEQILNALASLKPGTSFGRSGLKALLLGQDSGPQKERDNPGWGKLQGKIRPKALEELIERLIGEELIVQQSAVGRYGISYQALVIGDKGRTYLGQAALPFPEAETEADSLFPPVEPEPVVAPLKPAPVKIEAAPPQENYGMLVLRCLSMIDSGGSTASKIGRNAVVRLLLGQQSVLGTTSSNPYKGALEGKLKEKAVEALIDQLVAEGYLAQETASLPSGRPYQTIRLSADGWLYLNGGVDE